MSQRVAFIISAALTAFVLVLVGAVVGRISLKSASPAVTTEAGVIEVAADLSANPGSDSQAITTASPDLQMMLEREAAYQNLIREANQRLQSLYSGGQEGLNSPAVAVRMVDVAAIALNAVPGESLVKLPILVNFQGVTAYEVYLEHGVIYIDANTGAVLFSTTVAAPPIILPTNPPFMGSKSNPEKTSGIENQRSNDKSGDESGGGTEVEHEDGG